jgi:2-polyprenyl-3-methyl-5-hydroxy-6-metoxy-1,4-benzoquinol methylase
MDTDHQKLLAQLYTEYSALTDPRERFSPTSDEIEMFEKEFKNISLRGRALLEIGFGTGSLLAWAQQKGALICGCEVDPVSLDAAKVREIPTLPPDLASWAHQFHERYDVIAAFDVFEHFHLSELRQKLEACAIMLKPGGNLIARFPNAQSPFGQAPQHGDATHITPLSGAIIAQVSQGTGLRIVRYRNSARPSGRGFPKRVLRALRYFGQDAVELAIRSLYQPAPPMGPVVTIVAQKQ